MYYGLVYYPKLDGETEEAIKTFRRKYDPYVDCWKPHITFIFPVSCSEVKEEEITAHIETILRDWKPFPIHISGFTKSWDHWLFLLLKKGNGEAIALHDELYTGILSPYLRRDIEYIPHIGIGLFVRKTAEYNALNPEKVDFDAKLYSQALREAESLKLSSLDTVDRLFLDKIVVETSANGHAHGPLDPDLTKTVSSKEFKL